MTLDKRWVLDACYGSTPNWKILDEFEEEGQVQDYLRSSFELPDGTLLRLRGPTPPGTTASSRKDSPGGSDTITSRPG